MAKFFDLQVAGLDTAIKYIQKLKTDLVVVIDDELIAIAFEIQALAIQNLNTQTPMPADQGFLRNNIIVLQDEANHKFTTAATAKYAVYIEFGTGAQVDVPPELAEFAAQWKDQKNGGSFEDFVKNLTEWVKRKGISPDEGTTEADYKNMATLMAMDILHNGLKARPFFYPAYKQATKNLKTRINKIIKDIK